MDPDLNNYDLEHVCTAHALMSPQQWEGIYQEAWTRYYTPEHMVTLLRRGAATGVKMSSLVKLLLTFSLTVRLENVHPLQSGILRLRHPSERRPDLKQENAFLFGPRLWWETLHKTAVNIGTLSRLIAASFRISRDPKRLDYMDQALTPVSDDDDGALELLNQTVAAKKAVAHQTKIHQITASAI
jgi:hypothetical protein